MTPPIVTVVGKKKSGKTTTVVGLVRELATRGYAVMTVKSGHGFELDTEGRDSWRHRHEGGARRVVAAGPDGFAVMGDWPASGRQSLEDLVAHFLGDADIVIAEGYKASQVPRIEVYRRAAHVDPIRGTDLDPGAETLVMLTDVSDLDLGVPVLDVDAEDRFARLADLVETRFLGGGR